MTKSSKGWGENKRRLKHDCNSKTVIQMFDIVKFAVIEVLEFC